MKIEIEEHDGHATLTFEGELTIYSAAEAKACLLECIANIEELEINLAKVSEIDSAGVQLLLLIKREFSSDQKVLRLRQHSPAVLDIFELYNLAPYFGDPLVISRAETESRHAGGTL